MARASRQSNLSVNINQMSYRSKQKLQQLDKIQNNDTDPDSSPIDMSSESEAKTKEELPKDELVMYSEYGAGADPPQI